MIHHRQIALDPPAQDGSPGARGSPVSREAVGASQPCPASVPGAARIDRSTLFFDPRGHASFEEIGQPFLFGALHVGLSAPVPVAADEDRPGRAPDAA